MAKVALAILENCPKNTNPRGSIPGVQLEPKRLTLVHMGPIKIRYLARRATHKTTVLATFTAAEWN